MLKVCASIIVSVFVIVLAIVQTSGAKDNTSTQAEIDILTQKIDQKVASSQSLDTTSSSLQKSLTNIEYERTRLEKLVLQNSRDQRTLDAQIQSTKQRLHNAQVALGEVMASMYVNDSVSPLEMLASSGSVGQFIDRQTFRESAIRQLTSSIKQVESTRRQLLAQRVTLQQFIGDQQSQKEALAARQAKAHGSLAIVQGQVLELSKLTTQMKSEKEALQQRQQQSVRAALATAQEVAPGTISKPVTTSIPTPAVVVKPVPKPVQPKPVVVVAPKPTSAPSTVVPPPVATPKPTAPAPTPTPAPASPPPVVSTKPIVLPNGGYPNYLQNCYVDRYALSYGIDPWGYGCRQCVSYTAWKVLQAKGRAPMYWGNANMWPASAKRAGYKVSTIPRERSVGVMLSGPYGHVVWVESVNADKTINISQYNYWLPNKVNGGWGWYSEFKNVSPSAYQAYIYV